MDEYKILKEYEEAKQNGTLPEMPEELDEKCRELIDEAFGVATRRRLAKRAGTAIARAAMAVLILLGLSTVTVLSVDAFRVPVLNFVIDKSGKYSTIVLDPNIQIESAAIDTVEERLEAFMPDGYRFIKQESSFAHGAIVYKNENGGMICLVIENAENSINVDAEDVEYTRVEYGDYYAVFWEKDGYQLMWFDSENQVIYLLWASSLDESTFWELAYALIA